MSTSIMEKTFDVLDEKELSMIIRQAARRMVMLKQKMPDIGFWYTTLMSISKIIENNDEPVLNQTEINLILNPPPDKNGRTQAAIALRKRMDMRLRSAVLIVDKWMNDNKVSITHLNKDSEVNDRTTLNKRD